MSSRPVKAITSEQRLILETLRSHNATATRTSKTTVALVGKTTTLHVHLTYLYISLPFLHDYDVKMPNFTFQGGRKQATTKFYSLPKLEYGSKKFNSGRVHLLLTKYVSWNNRNKDQKNANLFLKQRFRCWRVVG